MNELTLNLALRKHKNFFGFFQIPKNIKECLKEGYYLIEYKSALTGSLIISTIRVIKKIKAPLKITISLNDGIDFKLNNIYKVRLEFLKPLEKK